MTITDKDVKLIRRLCVATVIAYIALGLLSFQATASLCALKTDFKTRVESSQQFLVEHPAGIPGVPVKTIQDGIANQQRTIRALRWVFYC